MTEATSSPDENPGPLGEWEELGRGIFSRSHRRKAAGTGVPAEVFLEHFGVSRISVDRLSRAPTQVAIASGERIAAERQPPRSFYGWAVVTVEAVRSVGCEAIDSPLPDNPYHADILLPESVEEDRDAQGQYAAALAGLSEWRPRP